MSDNLRARYWNMGSENKRGPGTNCREEGGELNSSPSWKLYFNPWYSYEVMLLL